MNTDSFLEELAEVLQTSKETLVPEFKLDQTNFDSLAMVSTVILFDEYFDIRVSGDELRKCRTVGDLLALTT